MRLLIECTYVFNHPHMKSGIQRVVRNIVSNLDETELSVEAIPVALEDGQVLRVKQLEAGRFDDFLLPLRAYLESLHCHYWFYFGLLERLTPFRQSFTMKRILFWSMKLVSLSFVIPLRLVRYFSSVVSDNRAVNFETLPGDVLVLLDSSWQSDFFDQVEGLKKEGVSVVSVIYDLIPMTHPQFCDDHLVKAFESWFDWIGRTADGYIAISDTVRAQLETYMHERIAPDLQEGRWYTSFHLGSDLDEANGDQVVRHELVSVFENESTYLTVSTIEPRKNHSYQLDVFEEIWADGIDARLCIVGKVGWKCKQFINRVRRHPELNKRLFMFNDLSDDELQHAYEHAKALLFTSYVEGFGLPIVEAAQRGLRVFCSDIPVFREVGGDSCAYCDLDSVSSLSALIVEYENSGVFPAIGSMASDWRTWKESTVEFIEGVSTNVSRDGFNIPKHSKILTEN